MDAIRKKMQNLKVSIKKHLSFKIFLLEGHQADLFQCNLSILIFKGEIAEFQAKSSLMDDQTGVYVRIAEQCDCDVRFGYSRIR